MIAVVFPTPTGGREQMSQLRPTHYCFDDALEFFDLLDVEALRRSHAEYRVVHAICELQGQRFAHAWVEHRGLIWQAGLLEDDRRVYYAVATLPFKVVVERRYTILEALEHNQRTNNLGPWDPKIAALCGRGSQAIVGDAVTIDIVSGVGFVDPHQKTGSAR